MAGFVSNLLDPSRATEFERGIVRASKRQFDDEPGGGSFDIGTYLPGEQAPGESADVPLGPGLPEGGTGDNTTSRIVGSVGRTFDDVEGGGVGEGIGQTAEGVWDSSPAWVQAVSGVVLLAAFAVAIGQLFTFNVGVNQ